MSNQSYSQEMVRAFTYLGQIVAGKDFYLAGTSCMNPEIREMVAFIDCYNSLNGTNEYQEERKALIILGRETWFRKEITDLALRVGENVKHESYIDSKSE